MQKIFDLISGFFSFVAEIPGWILDVITALFASVLLMLKDLVSWVFESILGLASSAISSFDFSGITAYVSYLGSLPAEVVNILGLCGIGEALGIIAVAIIIRIFLQLIPFTRLGS
jgi:hypothetical protein